MQPRAIAATIVSLGLAFTIVVWMGRVSQQPIVVDTTPTTKGPSEDKKPEVVKSGPKPKAVCEITDYDFGTMKLLSSGSHKFIIQNSGEGPLVLKAGPTTCQCTIGKLSAAIVAPGESTEVELKWTIKNPASWFEHSAEIWTNDADNTSIALKIGGFVGRDLIVKPEGSWSFGSITKIEEATFEGWVLSDLHPEMELLAATIDSDIFSVKLEKLTEEAILKRRQDGAFVDPSFPTKIPPLPTSGYRVIVKPVKEIPVGQFSYNLELTARMDDKVGEIKHHISIVGTKSGAVDFFALPGTTWLQNRMLLQAGTFSAEKGKKASLLMFVRGGDEEFKVTSLEKDLPWINVTTETKEKVGNADRVQMNIEFPAGCPKAVRTSTMPTTITLKTNHPEAAEITINLSFISE